MNKQKEVFFHVGLGKVASTYFQYRFFPKLKDIYYIQRTSYRWYTNLIEKSNSAKVLLSNEFDVQLEGALQKFSKHYPQGRIIIVLRRPDSWIASQYRRFVKNGLHKTFSEFIDVENDNGTWPREDLFFSKKLELIEEYMHSKPLVLLYDDFIADNYAVFDQIAEFIGVTYDRNEVSLNRKHSSYTEKQLKVVYKVSKYLYRQNAKPIKNYFLRKIVNWQRRFKSYFIMWFALLIPNALMSKTPLIPKDEMERVRKYYEDDWEKCVAYARAGVK